MPLLLLFLVLKYWFRPSHVVTLVYAAQVLGGPAQERLGARERGHHYLQRLDQGLRGFLPAEGGALCGAGARVLILVSP